MGSLGGLLWVNMWIATGTAPKKSEKTFFTTLKIMAVQGPPRPFVNLLPIITYPSLVYKHLLSACCVPAELSPGTERKATTPPQSLVAFRELLFLLGSRTCGLQKWRVGAPGCQQAPRCQPSSVTKGEPGPRPTPGPSWTPCSKEGTLGRLVSMLPDHLGAEVPALSLKAARNTVWADPAFPGCPLAVPLAAWVQGC